MSKDSSRGCFLRRGGRDPRLQEAHPSIPGGPSSALLCACTRLGGLGAKQAHDHPDLPTIHSNTRTLPSVPCPSESPGGSPESSPATRCARRDPLGNLCLFSGLRPRPQFHSEVDHVKPHTPWAGPGWPREKQSLKACVFPLVSPGSATTTCPLPLPALNAVSFRWLLHCLPPGVEIWDQGRTGGLRSRNQGKPASGSHAGHLRAASRTRRPCCHHTWHIGEKSPLCLSPSIARLDGLRFIFMCGSCESALKHIISKPDFGDLGINIYQYLAANAVWTSGLIGFPSEGARVTESGSLIAHRQRYWH